MNEENNETIETQEDDEIVDNPDEEEEPEEEEEESERLTSTDDLIDGTKPLAGKFQSVAELEKGYRNLQNEYNRKTNALHKTLLSQGWSYDPQTEEYIPPKPQALADSENQVATPATRNTGSEVQPGNLPILEYLDHDAIEEEALRLDFGSVPDGQPYAGARLDRYGAPIVPWESWEEWAEQEGYSDAQRDAAYRRYMDKVASIRLKGWQREQSELERQARDYEQRGTEEEGQLIEALASNQTPVLPQEQARELAEIWVSRAKQALEYGVRVKSITRAQLMQPGILTQALKAIIGEAQTNGEWSKVFAAVANGNGKSQTRRGTQSNRVVSTRIVSPSPSEIGGGTPARTTTANAETTFGRLNQRQQEHVREQASKLGRGGDAAFIERLAKEGVRTGKLRVRQDGD